MLLHPRMIPAATVRTKQHPDVFLLDLGTNPETINTIRQIQESGSTSKILLLSGIDDMQCLREVFAHGVNGVVLKEQPPAGS